MELPKEKEEPDLTELIYRVSHDFKAPIRHINQFTTLLLDKEEQLSQEERNSYRQMLEVSLDKLESLLEDLLNFGRISSENFHPEKVKLQSIIEEVNRKYQVNIVFGELAEVSGDSKYLNMLFGYLLQNSIDFSKRGEDLEVSIESVDKGAVYEILVKDNGIGIDPGLANKIFAFLERGAAKEGKQGNGAGLALAERIVSLHGGSIWVNTEAKTGFEIHFTLRK